ncbi:phosphotransferase [Cyanobium sp. HWJ4-Hawea]|uniref:ecdysteroid 22-kinase family protein n=1 Tax=unclassified Cyanobium TaxID=2627006 RepID=UPI0020CEE51D|nr:MULTISPECIES: ecdysteroid 22-kinase family protein [unclassified Cyanobium]MCP9774872.1 phosphotransferase [Cyanobium sp. WAJ14-Wanaka]MCP9808955.1 phosphotransferase [Cyanobium sp. HWJ4-Hawea]
MTKPAWLSQVLGQTVLGVRSEPLGEGLGLVSRTLRLELDVQPGANLPASLILKTESDDPAMRQLAKDLGAFEKETSFYGNLAAGLEATVPRLQASSHGGHEGMSWLLLEDLSALRAGNQVRGMRTDETAAALAAMAALHGRFWQNDCLLENTWLPAHQFWYQGSTGELTELVGPFLHDYELRVEPEAIELIRAVAESSEAIDQALAKRPWTLVHGDLRADNLLFDDNPQAKPETLIGTGPRVKIVDWGSPCRSLAAIDVACLIGGSTPMPQRRGRLKELLAGWHQTLLEQGVGDYSFEEAWRDLQLGCLRCLSGVLRLHHWQLDSSISPRRILLNDEAIERFCALALEVHASEALTKL